MERQKPNAAKGGKRKENPLDPVNPVR